MQNGPEKMLAKFGDGARWRRLTLLLSLPLALSMIVAACAGTDTAPEPRSSQLADLSGDITVDGSSTVLPITEAVAEEFRLVAPRVRPAVAVSGTGGGFKRFCSGETDISDASRPIKDSEKQRCADAGIDWIEVPVAIDGLAVIVNADNDFVDSLTVEELERIWKPGSEVTRWNQVRPQWPDQTIKLFGPGTDSGTFDYFTDTINGGEGASRSDYTASENDNVLVQGVAGERYALGYFGYAYYAENADKLKVLGIDPGDGNAVVPTDQSINNGTYRPLSRPLFIYVNIKSIQDKPQVRAFVETYLQEAPRLVPEVGYVPLPQAEYQQSLTQIQSGGS